MRKTTTTMTHPATLSTAPRRYVVFAHSAPKVAAEAAAIEARKTARAASRAETAARKMEKRAADLATIEAADLARAARAAADLAATEAANAEAAAATLVADPAAYSVAVTIEARTIHEARAEAAARFAAAATRGIIAHPATIRAYIDPRAAIEARAATDPARAVLAAAKVAYTEAPEAERMEAAAKVTEARRDLVAAEAEAEAAEAAALAEAPEAVARQVAKRATEREGTEKQWNIRRAAEAREHFDNDFFDMIAAARVPLVACLYGTEAEAATMEAEAAATYATAADPDPYTREAVTLSDLAAARAKERAAAIIRAKVADPAAPFWVADAYHAAFLGVNDHLTAARAIRTKNTPAPLSLDDLHEAEAATLAAFFDPEAAAEAEARAATLRAAFAKVAATLTPTRRRVWTMAGKGYTPEAIAAAMGRTHSTICEHLHTIRATAAAILKAEAPDLAAALLAADILQAADLAAAKREAAKREAAEATAKATEAARRAIVRGKANTPALMEAAEAIKAAEKAAAKARRIVATEADKAAAEAAEAEAAEALKRAASTDPEAAEAAKRAEAAALAADEAPATTTAAALAAAVSALSPIRRDIWARLAKGQSGRQIAREMGRNEATTREHIRAIRATLAAAMEATAPDLAEALKAADLATIAAAIA